MNIVLTVIVTVLMFGFLIATHEFGHFIVAKKCGVIVEEFSIGMGPLLFHKQGKDETQYSLRLFPVGGYCKMYGEDEDEDECGEGSLNSISPFKRILVLAAGAAMNLLTALIILLLLYTYTGTDPTTTLSTVGEDTPAYQAGLRENYTILQYGDYEIDDWYDISDAVTYYEDTETEIIYTDEEGNTYTKTIQAQYDTSSEAYKIGITPTYTRSFTGVIKYSISTFGEYVVIIFKAVLDLIRGVVGVSDLSGPIGVGAVINEAMSYGWIVVLNIVALIAVNLGVFNLLPIPALDGSRIFFCLVEILRRKPIDRDKEGFIHFIGFVLLMGLSVFVVIQDIYKLF